MYSTRWRAYESDKHILQMCLAGSQCQQQKQAPAHRESSKLFLQKYEVLGRLGEGTYGVVLKCRRKSDGHLVAIKKFKEADDDERVICPV